MQAADGARQMSSFRLVAPIILRSRPLVNLHMRYEYANDVGGRPKSSREYTTRS